MINKNKLLLVFAIIMIIGAAAVAISSSSQDEIAQLEQEISSAGYSWLVNYNISYPSVEVYRENDNNLLATFTDLTGGMNKIYLTNLGNESYDVFDLKSVGDVEYNYVVDPTYPESGYDIYDCGTIDVAGTYTLNQSISSTGTCMTITADDVTLDGNGKNIDSSAGNTIVVSGTRTNIIIKNFANITGSSNIINFDSGSSNSIVSGNNITGIGMSSIGIIFQGSCSGNQILSNTIDVGYYGMSLGSSSADSIISGNDVSSGYYSGIVFEGASSNNLINNTVINSGISSCSDGTYSCSGIVYASTSTDDVIDGNSITASQAGAFDLYLLSSADNLNLTNQIITNYNITGKSNITFTNSTWGTINLANMNGTGTNLIGSSSSDIKIGNNSVYVNSAQTGLNKSANITLYGIGNRGYTTPTMLRDGVACPAGICTNYTALTATNVILGVTGWSNYSIGDVAPVIGLSVIYPTGNINVTQNAFFNVTLNVSCTSGSCGSVNVSLDTATYSMCYQESANTSNQGGNDGSCGLSYGGSYAWAGSTVTDPTSAFDGNWSSYALFAPISSPYPTMNFTYYKPVNALNSSLWQVEDTSINNLSIDSDCFDRNPIIFNALSTSGGWITWSCWGGSSFITLRGPLKPPNVYEEAMIWNTTTTKGLINTTTGATPFYTNASTNPLTTSSLSAGQSQTIIFWVNATGDADVTHNFFAYANLTSNMGISNITNSWNVTIQLPGSSDITVSNCTNISTAGSYKLNQSISSDGTCITITADDVTLDGNGKTVTGNQNGNGVYILNKVNSTVKNCIITNFSTAIYLDSVNNSIFLNNTIKNNNGVFAGIYSYKGNYNNFTNLNFSYNNASSNAGLYLNVSSNNALVNNTFSLNNVTSSADINGGGIVGIYNLSSNNTLTNTIFNSNRVVMTGNVHLYGGGILGIYLNSNNNIITKTQILNNFVNGSSFMIIGGGAIGMSSSSNNILTNSTITGNSITSKYIYGGGAIGMSSSSSNNISASTITGNTITTSEELNGGGAIGMDSSSSNILTNSTITGNNITSKYVDGGGAIGMKSSSSNILTNSTITGNNIISDYVYGGGAIGMYLGSSNNNINTSTITGNSITSDTVEGGGAIGMYSSSSNILTNSTISGNTITTSTYINGGGAIGMYSSSSNRFTNLVLNDSSNRGVGIGLYQDCDDNSIENGVLTFTSDYTIGIYNSTSDYSTNNTFKNVTITGAYYGSLYIEVGQNSTNFIDTNIFNYSFTYSGATINMENSSAGRVSFIDAINGSGDCLYGCSGADIIINNNSAYVKSITPYCYQESANTTNQGGNDGSCSQSYTGTYAVGSGSWSDVNNVYDGNWGTSGKESDAGSSAFLYVNYTKPSGALISSLWQVKDGGGAANLSINAYCWNYSSTKLVFRIESQGMACLNEYTKITTLSGEKNIKDLNIGDYVLSYNSSGIIEYDKVIDVFSRDINQVHGKYYYIYTGTEEPIKATYNHEFYTSTGYKTAENLKVGDILLDKDLEQKPIAKIEIVNNSEDYVWDLTIENNHNFFAEGVLVHNELSATGGEWSCYNGTGWKILRTDSTNGYIYEEAMIWDVSSSSSNSGLNKSANITLYGIGRRFSNPAILRDGANCPASICTNYTALGAINVIFGVTGWSNYSIGESVADTTAPAISIITPTNNTNSSNNKLNVNYTVSDLNLQSCWYSNDTMKLNISLTPCGTNITTITWSEGQHNVTIWANDTANNINSSSVRFNIDSVVPTLTITYPLNITYTINVSAINYTITETNPSRCWYSNSSGVWNSTTQTAGTNFTNVISKEGSNTWTLYCNDTLNNVNSSSVTFVKDTVYPAFSTYLDNNASLTGSGTGWFNVTIANTNGTVLLEINNTNITATNLTGSVYNASHSFTSNGTYSYRWHAWGSGASGLYNVSATQSYTVLSDTTNPLISYSSDTLNDSTRIWQTNVYVNVSVTEANFKNITYKLYYSNNTLVNSTSYTTAVYSMNWIGLIGEDYKYNVSVFDTAGNKNSTATRSITIITSQTNISLNKGWNLVALDMAGTSAGDINISIVSGWNLIGYSSTNESLLENAVFINSSGNVSSWNSAVASNKIKGYASYYDSSSSLPSERKYKFAASSDLSMDDSSFRKNKGYWVYANQNGNLTLKGVGGSSSGSTYAWSKLRFANSSGSELNITQASNSTNAWVNPQFRYWDSGFKYLYATTDPDDPSDKELLSSWEGVFVYSYKDNLTLIRQN